MTESKICTCPSGDGSLRWPCPAHPAEQAGGDERAAFELFVRKHCGMPAHIAVNWDAKFTNDAWEGWKARAALAQPSQSQYEASFEEWLANELEGEDGQPVPAAFCDIALARRAFNHWPKLEHPAKVGGVRFSAGVSSRLVVEAAQRLYEFESTPEKEAERPEVVAVRYEDGTILSAEECGIALEVCAKVQTPLMTVSQHERIVGALRAEITQLRQHKNDYMDAGQETYRALQNEIREREAEIARLDGLVSGRTAERDAALVEVERLRESKGDPVGSLEKCMKVMYERDEHAKRLEAAMARVAELEKELAMARDAAAKGDAARRAAGGMEMEIQELREKVTELQKELRSRWTYASTQATNCAGCGEYKHTPLRVDWMGGYVCLTCIDKKLEELHDDQAQHSVPEEFIGRLSEFLAQRGTTGKALLRELHAMLSAAPAQGGE